MSSKPRPTTGRGDGLYLENGEKTTTRHYQWIALLARRMEGCQLVLKGRQARLQ